MVALGDEAYPEFWISLGMILERSALNLMPHWPHLEGRGMHGGGR